MSGERVCDQVKGREFFAPHPPPVGTWRRGWLDFMGWVRRETDPKGFQLALDAYWSAETPREYRIAVAWMGRYGMSPD